MRLRRRRPAALEVELLLLWSAVVHAEEGLHRGHPSLRAGGKAAEGTEERQCGRRVYRGRRDCVRVQRAVYGIYSPIGKGEAPQGLCLDCQHASC